MRIRLFFFLQDDLEPKSMYGTHIAKIFTISSAARALDAKIETN